MANKFYVFNQTTIPHSIGVGIDVAFNDPTFTITNTLPEQTVVLTEGPNITITGVHPNFSIASSLGATGGHILNWNCNNVGAGDTNFYAYNTTNPNFQRAAVWSGPTGLTVMRMAVFANDETTTKNLRIMSSPDEDVRYTKLSKAQRESVASHGRALQQQKGRGGAVSFANFPE